MEHAGVLQQKESQKRKNIKMRPQNQTYICGNGIGIRTWLPWHSYYSGMGSVMELQPVCDIMCVKGNTYGKTDTYKCNAGA